MEKFAFEKKNYQFMLIGLAVMILGYIFMSIDSTEYGFGALGLTVGPFTLFLGFVIEVFAIMWKPKAKNEEKHS